ncbi:MAG: peptide ABC transporter substrate-binding protein, partial [Planctomycetes bacterium]|nr:peptide ABC transporter substrate-binding protein [Planctomycetota bacterium]
VGYGLYHDWIQNTKVHMMSRNTMKYLKIIPNRREKYRAQENQPVLWPVIAFFVVLIVGSLPAIISVHRKRAGKK